MHVNTDMQDIFLQRRRNGSCGVIYEWWSSRRGKVAGPLPTTMTPGGQHACS